MKQKNKYSLYQSTKSDPGEAHFTDYQTVVNPFDVERNGGISHSQ